VELQAPGLQAVRKGGEAEKQKKKKKKGGNGESIVLAGISSGISHQRGKRELKSPGTISVEGH